MVSLTHFKESGVPVKATFSLTLCWTKTSKEETDRTKYRFKYFEFLQLSVIFLPIV